MKLKSLTLFAAFAFALSTPITSHAADVYIGASAGLSTVDTGVTATTGTASLDEDDTGYKIFAGIQINKIFGVEMHYADFGEASLSGNNGDTFALNGTTYTFTANDVNIAVGATSLGAAATVGHDFTNKLRAFAKLGLHAWELDASVTSSAGSASLTDSGTDLFYGIGAKYALTDRVSIRAEFERFNIDSDEIDFVSAGVSYRF